VQRDLATHPKRNPDQCPRTTGQGIQASCVLCYKYKCIIYKLLLG
jgi:hypothetical protein